MTTFTWCSPDCNTHHQYDPSHHLYTKTALNLYGAGEVYTPFLMKREQQQQQQQQQNHQQQQNKSYCKLWTKHKKGNNNKTIMKQHQRPLPFTFGYGAKGPKLSFSVQGHSEQHGSIVWEGGRLHLDRTHQSTEAVSKSKPKRNSGL